MRSAHFMYSAMAAAIVTAAGHAQTTPPPRPERAPRASIAPRAPEAGMVRAFGFEDDNGDRAVLGISTAGGGHRDTIGVLIASVTDGGPADKAGLEEGDRIAGINGVSLKMAPGDAGDPAIVGVLQRRLQREMRKVKAGDDVTLNVYSDGQYKTVKVKTIAADDLPGFSVRASRDDTDNRAVLGIELGSSHSRRDTLGLLIAVIQDGGPADKAGLLEGNRIAAINGTDVRVNKADLPDDDDSWDGVGTASRFMRVMRKVKAGDVVDLRVWSDGQYKNVKVTAGKASDVYKHGGFGMMFPEGSGVYNLRAGTLRALEPGMEQLRGALERLRTMRANVPPMRVQWDDGSEPMVLRMSRDDDGTPKVMRFRGGDGDQSWSMVAPAMAGMGAFRFGDGGMFGVDGLSLAPVNDGLAEYFGPDSKDGVLVLRASSRWDGLKAGDVILTVNGDKVKTDDGMRMKFDSDEDTKLEIIRHGKRQSLTIKAR